MDIPQPKKFKILLIGDACIDIYVYGTVQRISPEAPVPVFEPINELVKGGMASNVCKNLETLGCSVNFLHGSVSKKTRLIDQRSKQHVIRIDEDVESNPLRFETDIPTLYDAIVISDYNKGTVDYDLIEDLIKTQTVPIFIDTKKTDLARLNGCYIKINALEHSLIKTMPAPEWLIVTRGEKGAEWNGWQSTASRVEITDVTGAGDTFLAALCYQFLTTQDMRQAIEFANRAAGITVQHLGVYAPTLEEIQ
jgi:D-beta-D-heptose 7-phosphate kinase/D-beta-D-heptose 1-phosphate adenosyltransferase